ncbi:MAG TPA: LamG domain-containing protein [Fimbriimonas sp.]|nr:LamG domain-containing protein [Fimbriimonas sp.]
MLFVPPTPLYALVLTHIGDGLKVPHTEVLDLKGDLTLEAWIKPHSADNGGPFHFIVSKNYGGTGYALLLIGKGDNVRLQFEATDTVAYAIPMHVLSGHWWHVAGVYRGKKDISLYVNGVAVASHPTQSELQPSPLPLYIGTSPWDSFDGAIADVRLWRTPRTQEQIVEDMSSAPEPNNADLVAAWNFKTVARGRSYDLTHHTRPAEVQGAPQRIVERRRASRG